ncbi:uncharacterized protein BDV14DRAFT_111267 [Aspergillus stella-maris]|uniref:uncharacterized protein n=1 Tax=Aspergillus stella-maris TaxID=1810926 RepID=UPI003CCD9BFA
MSARRSLALSLGIYSIYLFLVHQEHLPTSLSLTACILQSHVHFRMLFSYCILFSLPAFFALRRRLTYVVL